MINPKKIALVLIINATLLIASNNFEESPRCKKKINDIKKELEIAKKMNNKNRVNGLNISLDKVNNYCSDEKLVEELEDKINEKKEDLQEHREDYNEAVSDKRSKKIKKYQSKIDEDMAEIKELQNELNQNF